MAREVNIYTYWMLQSGVLGEKIWKSRHTYCYIMQVEIVSHGQGRIFGEQSLQYDRPRAATVIATKPTKVWRLKKDDFMETSKYTKSLQNIFTKHAATTNKDGKKIMSQEDFIAAYVDMEDVTPDGIEALRAMFEIAE